MKPKLIKSEDVTRSLALARAGVELEPGRLVIVPHGKSVQVAVIEELTSSAVTLRCFAARTSRWTAPHTLPLNRLLNVVALDDLRAEAALKSIAAGDLWRARAGRRPRGSKC